MKQNIIIFALTVVVVIQAFSYFSKEEQDYSYYIQKYNKSQEVIKTQDSIIIKSQRDVEILEKKNAEIDSSYIDITKPGLHHRANDLWLREGIK